MNAPFDTRSMPTKSSGNRPLTVHTIRDSADTIDLRYGVQKAAEPKRFLFFLNGRTEWIEKYDYLAGDLELPDDCGFVSMDHRGQGGSGGARAFVDSYDTYAQDAADVIKKVAGEKPYAVLSHSMGGLIALHGTLKGHLKPTALVLSSPLLGMPAKPIPPQVAEPLSKVLTALRLGGVSTGSGTFTTIPFEQNALTHHADLYLRMQNSPFKVPGATFAWVQATFEAIRQCFDQVALARLEVPTLVLGGTKEGVVDPEAIRRWVRTAGMHARSEVQLRLVNGAKHELFSELPEYYGLATAAVRAWLKQHRR